MPDPEPHYPSAASRAFDTNHEERRQEAVAGAPPKPKTPKEAWDFAKKQAEERRALSKKHADARRSAKDTAAKAALDAGQGKEVAELKEKQAKDRATFDPTNQSRLPTFNGLSNQDAVAALHDDLVALAPEQNFEVGDIHTFGLEFDVFDPVTGMVTSPARAHRRDVGDIGILQTAEAVVSDIISARQHQMTAGVTQYAADRIA